MPNVNGKPRKKDEITCVQLSKDTKKKLDQLGTKSQTYEDIITGLMEKPCANSIGENEENPNE